MSLRYKGGVLSATPATSSSSAATGVWTLPQQMQAQGGGNWPPYIPPDAQFNYVTMLLHGDGTNGAQNNTFLDSSSNAFSITRNGNTTQGTFSPYGPNWSVNFVRLVSGYGDSLTVADNAVLQMGTGDFTIEMWVYESGTVSYQTLYEKGYLNSGAFLIQMATDLKPYIYANGSLLMTSSTAFAVGVWTHFAVVRSGSTMTMYMNGVSVASASNSTNFNDASGVGIGATYTGSIYPFNGYLSNLRVVKGTAVYTGAFTPPTSNLTAISGTSLLTCQSNRFVDNSSNALVVTTATNPSAQRFNPFGETTAYNAAAYGGSGYFDGSGDYLSTTGSYSLSGNYTIEGWMYAFAGDCRPFGKGDHSAAGIGIYCSATSFTVMIGGTNIFNITSLSFLQRWLHFAIVKTSGTIVLYLNGVSQGSVSDSTTLTGTSYIAAANYGGTVYVGASPCFLTDIRVVSSAVYSSGFTPPTAPLTAITGTLLLTSMTNGAIYDNSMINVLETVNNAQISTSVYKYGTGSLKFNGAGDGLKIQNTQQLRFGAAPMTVEFWMYPTASPTGGSGTIIGDWTTGASSGPSNWLITTDGSTLYFFATNGNYNYYDANQFALSTTYSLNTWTYIAIAYDGTTMRLFKNGTLISSGAFAGFSTNSGSFTNPMSIGAYYTFTGSYGYIGYIDDLRVTKGYCRYTSTFTAPTTAFSNSGPT